MIWDQIVKNHNLTRSMYHFEKRKGIKEIPLRFSFKHLQDTISDILKEHKEHPWLDDDEKWYSGIGLTYNPIHNIDIMQSSLGIPQNADDTYRDSMAFTELTPAGKKLKWFFDLIPLTPIKSRLAIVDASKWKPKAGWHQDESIFCNLRLNIPIWSNNKFGIQLDNCPPQILENGKCYSWDTGVFHRPWVEENHNTKRYSLVLGFSPWFTLKDNDWTPNRFYGNTNPLDIWDFFV